MKDSSSTQTKQRTKAVLISIGIACFWLAVWAILYHGVGRDVIIPSPFAVVAEIRALLHTPDFWLIVGNSVVRVLFGIVFALAVGGLGGIASAFSPVFGRLTRPVIAVIQATPVVSFIIIALIWFQSDHVAIFISFLMCLPIVWNNVSTGIRAVDRDLVEMARVFRVTRWERFLRVYLPSIQPYLIAAMTTVLGLAWKVSVAAEVLSHPRYGIGTKLHGAKVYLDTPNLFAWTAIVVLLSMGFDHAFGWGIRRVAQRRKR